MPDGSIGSVLQTARPDGASVANWLPTPADGRSFTLFTRAYEPTGSVLQGTFVMPSAEPVQWPAHSERKTGRIAPRST
ncbi:DUF1214 domain-containing protein [Burkholderia lata]|uniref:DUF1214 domain-containing protein n=1 Tax=Burkholderia lata (strain ATCC 17760 / DSM 23089 / LMG 22485 / NCIMB 9086 / R18194 / 383) TaxID=482957 RepID=A0A6P2YKM0_BURL3|nr:DUF1214 domain-containing protein [Burkholderia lata]VWD22877.1 hypothetical protein BLA18109_06077 [Burkholderia lata]